MGINTKKILLFFHKLWFNIARYKINSIIAKCLFSVWHVKCGVNLKVNGLLRLFVNGEMKVGDNVRLNSGSVNYVGGDRKLSFYVLATGCLEIEDGCAISNSTIMTMESIKILNNTFIGGGCRIYDMDFHQINPNDRIFNKGPIPCEKIVIGPRAFIGGHSIILKGVTIGEGAVVGAGSVVTKSIPPFEVWAGAPAKYISKVMV